MLNLRPYQLKAVRAIQDELATHHSTLLEMATGLGKTVCMAHLADQWPGRVLVMAHRDELIRQAAEKITAVTGRTCSIEMGRDRSGDELYGTKVTVGSVQTLARAERRGRFHPDHFSLIIVDEGHHATAVTYRETMDYFVSARRLFVTATPKRFDKVGMECVCESVAFQYGIEPAIDDGWLVPVYQSIVNIDSLDFSKARTVAEDFNQADLDKILNEEKPLHAMVASACDLIGNRQSLWFCVSIRHARTTAAVISRYEGEGTTAFISGDTPTDERRAKVDAYKAGRIQHLTNCGLFLEGFDAPSTSAVVMARPTKSVALYTQILGRGTRPLPGIVDGIETPEQRRQAISMSDKPHMIVIDYAGNAGKHKIIQASDVLGGKYPPPVREYAKATMINEGADEQYGKPNGGPVSLEEALARASMELALEAEQDARRRKIKAEVQYTEHHVSPFAKSQRQQPLHQPAGEPCSDKQARYIVHLSGGSWTFVKAKELTTRQARGIIGRILKKKAPS